MKKSGFTLIEILISLAIIGCIAAFMIPAMMNSKPDNNKALFLKTYDELSQAIQALVNDSKIYPLCDANNHCGDEPNNNIYYQTYPFTNTCAATFEDGTEIGSDTPLDQAKITKFRDALAHSLGMAAGGEFTLPNGVLVRINNDNQGTWHTRIEIDVNANSEPNCFFNYNNCKQPDRFVLSVAADGQIYFGDNTGSGMDGTMGFLYKQSENNMRRPNIPEQSTFEVFPSAACFRIPRVVVGNENQRCITYCEYSEDGNGECYPLSQ